MAWVGDDEGKFDECLIDITHMRDQEQFIQSTHFPGVWAQEEGKKGEEVD